MRSVLSSPLGSGLFSRIASTQRPLLWFEFTAPGLSKDALRPACFRRFCIQLASVEYLIPTYSANWAALPPLRSHSSSNISRLALGNRTRPLVSRLNLSPLPSGVDVIEIVYDIYAIPNRGPPRDAYESTNQR